MRKISTISIILKKRSGMRSSYLAISLNNLNNRNRSFAYPYGEYKEETIEILKQLGFEMAFNVDYDDTKPGMNMFEIPRKGFIPRIRLKILKR
jgi:peptidoglycan/xylan/chitin deacetylase (PgdA/CDA1 family)